MTLYSINAPHHCHPERSRRIDSTLRFDYAQRDIHLKLRKSATY